MNRDQDIIEYLFNKAEQGASFDDIKKETTATERAELREFLTVMNNIVLASNVVPSKTGLLDVLSRINIVPIQSPDTKFNPFWRQYRFIVAGAMALVLLVVVGITKIESPGPVTDSETNLVMLEEDLIMQGPEIVSLRRRVEDMPLVIVRETLHTNNIVNHTGTLASSPAPKVEEVTEFYDTEKFSLLLNSVSEVLAGAQKINESLKKQMFSTEHGRMDLLAKSTNEIETELQLFAEMTKYGPDQKTKLLEIISDLELLNTLQLEAVGQILNSQ